jgi:dTDP-glucose 4,6-dehydratase
MLDARERVLVTGGAGFIGSAVCRHLVGTGRCDVVNFDKLTYSGNLASLASIENEPAYRFHAGDIGDAAAVLDLLQSERITRIMHLAAESHVDRSIDSPAIFLETNVFGTFHLLSAALRYWNELEAGAKSRFRFHHVSTDEVFGDLPFDDSLFREDTPYRPSSPYSASKAASDHLVLAWHHTYGLPVVLSNCSNNYGPYHFPEKLIPLVILNALDGQQLPIYGEGTNVRDWLFVEDHARALETVLFEGRIGETYLIGGRSERTNLQVVEEICRLLDEKSPLSEGGSYLAQISFVADRPGHDRRYAVDPAKIERELGWHPRETFESGLATTIDWYLARSDWWQPLRKQRYSGARLGRSNSVDPGRAGT